MNLPIWIFWIFLTSGRIFSTLFAPRYISPSVIMDSNIPSSLEVTFYHGFGVLPVKAEVQAQAIGLKVYTGFVYPGVGSSHNDDDLGQKRGGVLYFYNDTHVVLYGASNAEGTGAGIIFTGQISYTRDQQEFSTVASVRVRVWHPGDFPVPVFQSGWLFMSAGSNGTTFIEVPHGLGAEPDHVVVHVRGNDGRFYGLVGEAQGSSLSREHYSAGLTSSWGGVIFGYNNSIVRILAPSTDDSDVSIMCAKDGWGNRRSDASYSGHVRITAWYLSNSKFIATPAHFSHDLSRDDPRDHFFLVPQIDKDMDLVTVQAKSKSGPNQGFYFYAGGAAMVDNVNTWVGGFVYAYTDSSIHIWHQNDWCIILVPHYFGGDRVPECTREADIVVRVWSGTHHITTYTPMSTSTNSPNASFSTGVTNATTPEALSTSGLTYGSHHITTYTPMSTSTNSPNASFSTGVTNATTPEALSTSGLTYATTAGVVSSQATTAGGVSSDATTAGDVSSKTITAGDVSSKTTTAGGVSSDATTAGDVSSKTITAGDVSSTTTTAGDVSSKTITSGDVSSTTTTAGDVSSTTTTAGDVSSKTITVGDVSSLYATKTEISVQATTLGGVSFGGSFATSIAVNYSTTPSTFTLTLPMPISGPCYCRSACNKIFILPDNMTLTDFFNSLLMEMTVLKNETSKHRRSLVSAKDKRRSSQIIGYAGIIVILCTFGMIFLLDLATLWQKITMTNSRTSFSTKHP